MGVAVVFSIQSRSTGAYYAEMEMALVGEAAELDAGTTVGVTYQTAPSDINSPSDEGVGVQPIGTVLADSIEVTPTGDFSYAAGDTVMIAFDAATGLAWFGKNGTWNGDPAAGTGAANDGAPIVGTSYKLFFKTDINVYTAGDGASALLNARTAQQTYAAPTGFDPWEDS